MCWTPSPLFIRQHRAAQAPGGRNWANVKAFLPLQHRRPHPSPDPDLASPPPACALQGEVAMFMEECCWMKLPQRYSCPQVGQPDEVSETREPSRTSQILKVGE